MYKIVSFFHASTGDKKFCRITRVFKQKMIRKLKILAKNGQISMKKSFKNGRFCPIFDEKRLREYSICGAGLMDFKKCACGVFS